MLQLFEQSQRIRRNGQDFTLKTDSDFAVPSVLICAAGDNLDVR